MAQLSSRQASSRQASSSQAFTANKLSQQEKALIAGCQKGDEKSWLLLYQTYHKDLGFFLKGMLYHNAEIEDLLQIIFLEFLKSIHNFRGESSVRTWLYRIARNVALKEAYKVKRRKDIESQYTDEIISKGLTEHKDIAEKALVQDQLNHVQTLLAQLDASFREVWILRELKGYSVIETAEILEIKEATVRSRHFRARHQLLQLLKQQHMISSDETPSETSQSDAEDISHASHTYTSSVRV